MIGGVILQSASIVIGVGFIFVAGFLAGVQWMRGQVLEAMLDDPLDGSHVRVIDPYDQDQDIR